MRSNLNNPESQCQAYLTKLRHQSLLTSTHSGPLRAKTRRGRLLSFEAFGTKHTSRYPLSVQVILLRHRPDTARLPQFATIKHVALHVFAACSKLRPRTRLLSSRLKVLGPRAMQPGLGSSEGSKKMRGGGYQEWLLEKRAVL